MHLERQKIINTERPTDVGCRHYDKKVIQCLGDNVVNLYRNDESNTMLSLRQAGN